MKDAYADDVWRHVQTYDRNPFVIQRIELRGLTGLANMEISPANPLTVICGANGAGKSTLLQAVAALFDEAAVPQHALRRMDGVTAEVTVREGRRTSSWTVQESSRVVTASQRPSIDVVWCDPSADALTLRNFLRQQTNLEELVQQEGAIALDPQEHQRVQYLVGRDYDSIEVVELNDAGFSLASSPGVIPYFRVKSGTRAYGAEDMGLGEFALHLSAWRLRRAEAKSILFMEEPETYVAPRSQVHLVNLIAEAIKERKLTVFLTTHSPAVVQRVPRESTLLLARQGDTCVMRVSPSDAELAGAIGFARSSRGALLVEDPTARDLLSALLDRFAPDVRRDCQIVVTGMDGALRAVTHSLDRRDGYRVVAVLDGDQRGAHAGSPGVAFLPGESAPERDLRVAAKRHVDRLAKQLNRERDELHVLLSSVEGRDHHDWYEELRKGLGISGLELARALLSVLVLDRSHERAAKLSVKAIGELLATMQQSRVVSPQPRRTGAGGSKRA